MAVPLPAGPPFKALLDWHGLHAPIPGATASERDDDASLRGCGRIPDTSMDIAEAVLPVPADRAFRTDPILRWYDSRINYGIVEGMNSQFKPLIRRCRGFANVRNVITTSYMLFSGLSVYFTDEELACLNVRPGRSPNGPRQTMRGCTAGNPLS